VTASTDRSQLVLPKGHIESGEDPRETAVREVKEESGHWARVIQWIEDKPLSMGEQVAQTRFYLMDLVEEKETMIAGLTSKAITIIKVIKARVIGVRVPLEPTDKEWQLEKRKRYWLSIDQAEDSAKYPETKALLRHAERKRLEVERQNQKKQTREKIA